MNSLVLRVAKVLGGFVAVTVVASILAMAAYDLFVFQPRMGEIRTLLSTARPAERNPSPPLIRVVRTELPASRLSGMVARHLLSRFETSHLTQGRQHLQSFLWWTLVALHLTEAEQLTLHLSLSEMGGSVAGFDASSMDIVGTPLSEVSIEQAAVLVTVAKAPAAFRGSPDRLDRRAQALTQRIQGSAQGR